MCLLHRPKQRFTRVVICGLASQLIRRENPAGLIVTGPEDMDISFVRDPRTPKHPLILHKEMGPRLQETRSWSTRASRVDDDHESISVDYNRHTSVLADGEDGNRWRRRN